MSQAFSEVRLLLGLSDATDQITGIVARGLVELAQQGVSTKSALVMRATQEFKASLH
jgi:hypothetical protein